MTDKTDLTDLNDDVQFDAPNTNPSDDGAEPEEADSDWETPSDESEEEVAGEAFAGDETDTFGESLLESHALVAEQLAAQAAAVEAAGATASAEAFAAAGNVVGVGLGVSSDLSGGSEPGAPALNVYVAEACSQETMRSLLVDSMGVSAASEDRMPINVIVTGLIDAQPHRFKIRPAPGGVSVGHTRVTAGTLGCLARGRRRPRNRRRLILSNNHVLANSNNARFGNSIVQPGRADGGTSPRDRIAILERFVPIKFGSGTNYVDCATGWAWPTRVRREQVYLRGGRPAFFRISNLIRTPRVGMAVGKSGRTTQLTRGRITDVHATINVNYGGGKVAHFKNQVAIRSRNGSFSRGGDSGSVIWTWDGQRRPVALLFAGGGGFTFANKMSRVVRALDIRLAN